MDNVHNTECTVGTTFGIAYNERPIHPEGEGPRPATWSSRPPRERMLISRVTFLVREVVGASGAPCLGSNEHQREIPGRWIAIASHFLMK